MPDDAAGEAGPRRWQEDVDPDVRRRVIDRILVKLEEIHEGQPSPSRDFNIVAASFEQKMFSEADNKEDYMKRASQRLVTIERNRRPQNVSGLNRHVKTGSQMQPVNYVRAIHGGNSSVTAMPQESPHMQRVPVTPSSSSPVLKQHMAHPVAPNMHIKDGQKDAMVMLDQILHIKDGQKDVMAMLDHLKSSSAIVTPSSPVVRPSQLTMQPAGESCNQNKLPLMQMQSIIFSGDNATIVTESQGQSVVQPNGEQNPLRQNTIGSCMSPQKQLRMNHQGLEVNQQKMNPQNNQMLVEQRANVAKMQTGHPREQNNKQNAGLSVASPLQADKHITMEPQPLITVNHQSSLHSEIHQTVASMEGVEEVDWKEEMFQQIKALKDAYLPEIVALDEISAVPKITKEYFESLPRDKAEQYRFRVYMKTRIRAMLNILLLQKSNIPEHFKGKLPMFVKALQNVIGFYRRKKEQKAQMEPSQIKPQIVNLTGDPAPFNACTSQQKQPVQSVAFHSSQNTATRKPAASRENHNSILLGVESSCVPMTSPGSVQSFPSNKLQDYCTLSPVTKENPVKVSSLSASATSILSSPVAKPGAVIGAPPSVSSPIDKLDLKVSPSASVKSTLPSPTAMFGLQAALTSPSPLARTGIVKVAKPPVSVPLPPAIEKVEITQAASTNPLIVQSALSTLGSSSGGSLLSSSCASMKSTSSENLGTVSDLLQKNNAVPVVSMGCTTNLLMPSSLVQAETANFQGNDLQHGGGQTLVTKKPRDRLIDAVRSLSPAALESAVNSMRSVIRMDDWVAHEEFDSSQHWPFFSEQGGSNPQKQMERIFEITESNPESSPLVDTSEVEANAVHGAKRQKTQDARSAVLEEIESTNNMLIDTIITIADDTTTDGTTCSSGGTLIELSYAGVSLALDLKSFFATSEMPIVRPAKLLVPSDYPRSSPVLVDDQRHEQLRNIFSGISDSADAAFRNTIDGSPEPRSIRETVKAWDACVRQAVAEFAHRLGGGTFSSRYGRWESSDGGAMEMVTARMPFV